MKTNLGLLMLVSYSTLSVVSLLKPAAHWAYSAILGPTEHLGLLVRLLRGTNNYIDGIRRFPAETVWLLIMHACIWLIGIALCVWLTTSSETPPTVVRTKVLVATWCVVAVANVWLFSIRSV